MTPTCHTQPVGRAAAIAAWRECAAGAKGSPGVTVTEDWFSVARAIDASGQDAWSTLVEHTRRELAAALVLSPRDESICLRADVPLDDRSEASPAHHIREACDAVHIDAVPGLRDDGHLGPPRDEVLRALAGHLDELGWPARDAGDGRIAVELEVPDGWFQATVSPARAGVSFVATLVTSAEGLSDPARNALACLLLRGAGSLRLVRPFARESADAVVAGFDITWSGVPTAAEVAHSLCALSVACGLCGREAEALRRDDDLARRYFEIQTGVRTRTTNRPAAGAAG